MKKTIITITSIFACAFASFAADAACSNACCAAKPAKQINTLADEEVCANILERFSASVTVGYESEYVFRGLKEAGASVNPEVDAAYDLGSGFAVYAGFWGNMPVKSGTENEMDLYTGITYDIKNFTFDLGYLAYLYSGDQAENSHEIKFAVSYDTVDLLGEFNVSPTIAFFHDFSLDSYTLESGLTYSAPVTKWIADRNWGTIDLAAVYGWCSTKNIADRDGYTYIALSADAVVALNDYCKFAVGIRYAYAHNRPAAYRNCDETVWYGASMTVGF